MLFTTRPTLSSVRYEANPSGTEVPGALLCCVACTGTSLCCATTPRTASRHPAFALVAIYEMSSNYSVYSP
ncbi:hypothetical protein GCM10010946_14800 [Undibacterium squillarum]|uniref:Uncharacterized protein n=1 Tax=Undibacterium squillarum TaxID=1131567 RepID=A0ABQ2XWG4_9BURK|nr:hypothetical protein GCM10010946_14800 [Undibacterium squillarum]